MGSHVACKMGEKFVQDIAYKSEEDTTLRRYMRKAYKEGWILNK
jgi:hypothetical protein